MVSINPTLVHVHMPDINSESFEIVISYHVLDLMRGHSDFDNSRKSLEICLERLGYRLTEEGITRLTKALQVRTARFKQQLSKTSGKKSRDALIYWA